MEPWLPLTPADPLQTFDRRRWNGRYERVTALLKETSSSTLLARPIASRVTNLANCLRSLPRWGLCETSMGRSLWQWEKAATVSSHTSLYPLYGERLEAASGDGCVELWIGVESASSRPQPTNPRHPDSSVFDVTGIVVATSSLEAGISPLGDLWHCLPQIVKILDGVYACGLADELGNLTMTVGHHFEKLVKGQMPGLAGPVVIVPESSSEMLQQLERAAAGTDARLGLTDGYGTLWCSDFPVELPADDDWWRMATWITNNLVIVTARGTTSWPTFIGKTNVDPSRLAIDGALVDSLKAWGAIAKTVSEDDLKLDNFGFPSVQDCDRFISEGLAAAQQLANTLQRQVSYSPVVGRHHTVHPQT